MSSSCGSPPFAADFFFPWSCPPFPDLVWKGLECIFSWGGEHTPFFLNLGYGRVLGGPHSVFLSLQDPQSTSHVPQVRWVKTMIWLECDLHWNQLAEIVPEPSQVSAGRIFEVGPTQFGPVKAALIRNHSFCHVMRFVLWKSERMSVQCKPGSRWTEIPILRILCI